MDFLRDNNKIFFLLIFFVSISIYRHMHLLNTLRSFCEKKKILDNPDGRQIFLKAKKVINQAYGFFYVLVTLGVIFIGLGLGLFLSVIGLLASIFFPLIDFDEFFS